MGCDIHLYMEYKNQKSSLKTRWNSFGYRIYVGRHYTLFGYMAGVRSGVNPIAAPRGIPDDIDYNTMQDYYYGIGDVDGFNDDGERTVTLEHAERWGTKIEMNEHGQPYRIKNPDWHTASWLTFGEYTSALALVELDYYKECGSDKLSQALKDHYMKEAKSYIIEHKAVAASMATFENIGYKTRVVFWFDN